MRRVEVAGETETLLIKLIFNSANYNSFIVTVKDASARDILAREDLKAQSAGAAKHLSLKVPAKSFADGEYFLTIAGVKDDGVRDEIVEYAFRLIKK